MLYSYGYTVEQQKKKHRDSHAHTDNMKFKKYESMKNNKHSTTLHHNTQYAAPVVKVKNWSLRTSYVVWGPLPLDWGPCYKIGGPRT